MMNDVFLKYEQLVNSFPLAVRVFILTAAMGIIYLLWNFLLWQPIQKKNEYTSMQTQKITKEINLLQTQVDALKEKKRIQQAQIQTTNISSSASPTPTVSIGFIDATKIPDMLKYLISFRHNLIFSSIQVMRPKLMQNKVQEKIEATSFFEHDIVFKFRGSYFDVLNYLQTIEKLNWPIYWDRLEYKVEKYPIAEITLQIHFLSE